MNPTVASKILAPSKDEPEHEHNRRPETITGTGTTEVWSRSTLKSGVMATLMVGATAVRIAFRGDPAVANSVELTDLLIPASSSFTWVVDPLTKYVYLEAGDAVASFQAWLWRSSP